MAIKQQQQNEIEIYQGRRDEHVCFSYDTEHAGARAIMRTCHNRRRPRPRPRNSLAAALTVGAALVSTFTATASASTGGTPPPPPPPSNVGMGNGNSNSNRQYRSQWVGWTAPPPPPPPPPLDDPADVPVGAGGSWGGAGGNRFGGDRGAGERSDEYEASSTMGAGNDADLDSTQHGSTAAAAAGMAGQRRATVEETHGSYGEGSNRSGEEFGRYDQQKEQQRRGLMGMGGGFGQQQQQPQQPSQGGAVPDEQNPRSSGNGMVHQQYNSLHQQQSLYERMMSSQQGQAAGSSSLTPRAYPGQHGGQRGQQVPPSWTSGSPAQPPPPPGQGTNGGNADRFYGNPMGNGAGLPLQEQQQQPFNGGSERAGMGMMGEAEDGRWGADVQTPPPSHGTAGAITPEVKLSQYRQGATGAGDAAGGGGRGGDAGADGGDIPRSLLSNTDKEVIFDGLKKLYRKKILPLEESSRYAHFHSPPMNPADFEAKPMVLIVGQYSVGKTSFIRSLLKKDFPGQRVGPEPTTDRFVAVTHGEDERVMPGHALAMQADKPFRSLQQFGNNFLTKFEGSVVDAPILRNITLVDTPGVLSGEKQRIGRDYDFASVISWFAERADLIVVMFDAHKLDISDELKMVIDALKPHHDKMRVLLNKADTIDTQQLMRVYGALMWSLGKVMQTPEVCRVYIGSFWEAPLSNFENRVLLEREKNDLLDELMLLPENAVVRRINELVKRARSVKVHAYIIHYLRKQMPYMMGKQDKQEKLIRRLDQEFLACARRYGLPLGDFPKVEKFRRSLREIKDISKFKSLDKSLVHEMDKVFSGDIPKLMEKAARPGNR